VEEEKVKRWWKTRNRNKAMTNKTKEEENQEERKGGKRER
jgi:hypothetical protein